MSAPSTARVSSGFPGGGQFAPDPHPAANTVCLSDAAGPTASDLALRAQLDAEMTTAAGARARVEMLSLQIAAEGVLRRWPNAAYVQMDYSDYRNNRHGAVAILGADGEVLDDDLEAWTALPSSADRTN